MEKQNKFKEIEITWSKPNLDLQTYTTIHNKKEWSEFQKMAKRLKLQIINIQKKEKKTHG